MPRKPGVHCRPSCIHRLDQAKRAKTDTCTVFVEAHPEDEEIPMQTFIFKYNSETLLKALKKSEWQPDPLHTRSS